MTTETREALTGLADAVNLLAEYSEYSVHVRQRADRLIRALEQEAADRGGWQLASTVQPLRRPTVNLISTVKLAVLANGGFAWRKELCKCDPSVKQSPCRYCAIHEGLTKAFTFLRALKQERDRVELDPFGCHKHVAQWLEAEKYRTLAHRHDGTFAAVDEAEQRKMRADTLPLLSDALLNWKQEATWLKVDLESTAKAIATDYETWRDEQLDTLRKLFLQRGPKYRYQSFPDFCREQWEGSDKGKVKV